MGLKYDQHADIHTKRYGLNQTYNGIEIWKAPPNASWIAWIKSDL